MAGFALDGSFDLAILRAFATSTAAAFNPFLYSNSAFTIEKFATFTLLTSLINPSLAISSSIGFETVLAATWAVAPGIFVMTTTWGLFASGNRFLGSVIKPMIPITKKPTMIVYKRYGRL